jgi:hypothetical protein
MPSTALFLVKAMPGIRAADNDNEYDNIAMGNLF